METVHACVHKEMIISLGRGGVHGDGERQKKRQQARHCLHITNIKELIARLDWLAGTQILRAGI